MSRALVVLTDGAERSKAINWINKAPTGTRVQFLAAQRSVDQNSKLWAMLSEVAAQCPWHGVKLTTEDWKFIFLDALKRELRVVPNLDGNGFVNLGRSSSDLSKAEMSDLIELIMMFGAEHNIKFKDDPNPSQDSHPETVEPAPTVPPVSGAGSNPSSLPDGWRTTYLTLIGQPCDSPKALLARHNDALTALGGKPTDEELTEMRALYGLRQRNLFSGLSNADYETAVRELV